VNRFARGAAALVLLAAAGFCVFGFLATYEPPGFPAMRAIYAVAGSLCLFGMVVALLPRGERR
jgi:peptidoglycan/LPS O-acetylase OafA/YrhL